MAGKSKFFVVATEGGTTDGRTISRGWIEQMARTYSPKTYGARVNMEHYRGILPDGPFKAYGDVLAVKTQEGDGGKLQLLAQIDPTADLIELNKKRQKVYTSIEINPNFAESGEAYLVGIAVTDSPASLGTEMLQFASKAQVNPFEARKADKGNVITEAIAFALELEEPEAKPTDNGTSLLSKVRELLSGKTKGDEQRAGDSLTIGGLCEPIWNRLPCNRAMVLAILNRTKLQTRRGVSLPKCLTWGKDFEGQIEVATGKHRGTSFDVDELRTPYGRRGDRLWVTEAWRVPAAYDQVAPRDLPRAVNVRYEADGYQRIGTATREALSEPWGKLRPGMFMPRSASRISLAVQDARAERLQEICESDAIAEGIERSGKSNWRNYLDEFDDFTSARRSFKTLWESIYGLGSWDQNPWVFVTIFELLEPAIRERGEPK